MSNLPLDVASEILSQLPVKSLLRFRCVSKEWCTLIDSPDFIKLHLNHSIKTGTNLSLIVAGFHDMNIRSIDLRHLPTLDNAVELHHDHVFKTREYFHVVGSCNGLLALYDSQENFSLWNPSTKRHQILPKFWNDYNYGVGMLDGFGYDNVTDDYKIVRVIQVRDRKTIEVVVYSLKGKSTRVINYIDFPYYFYPQISVLVAGSLHWKARSYSSANQTIMAFDLVDEEFHEVQLPDTINRDRLFTMGILGGCLYISCKYRAHAIVWVMKEYRIKDSWTKLVKVSGTQIFTFVKALAYSNSGDKVLIRCRRHDDNVYYWYDLEKKKRKPVKFNDEPKKFYDTVICLGSLVPLNVNERNLMVRGTSGVSDAQLLSSCTLNKFYQS